jgi:hypothetical protein
MVFHPAQASHRPFQRLWVAPQLWQMKVDRALAMDSLRISRNMPEAEPDCQKNVPYLFTSRIFSVS